jgi:hypothetical protein
VHAARAPAHLDLPASPRSGPSTTPHQRAPAPCSLRLRPAPLDLLAARPALSSHASPCSPHRISSTPAHCYSCDGARKELWRLVDVGAVSPCAW